MNLATVRAGLVGVPAEDEIILGILLVFDDDESANEFFDAVKAYFDQSRGERSFTVSGTTSDSTLTIFVHSLAATANVEIAGIDNQILASISGSLARHPYYFIVGAVAIGDDDFRLCEINGHHVYKADIVIDGDTVMGRQGGPWPVGNPLLALEQPD